MNALATSVRQWGPPTLHTASLCNLHPPVRPSRAVNARYMPQHTHRKSALTFVIYAASPHPWTWFVSEECALPSAATNVIRLRVRARAHLNHADEQFRLSHAICVGVGGRRHRNYSWKYMRSQAILERYRNPIACYTRHGRTWTHTHTHTCNIHACACFVCFVCLEYAQQGTPFGFAY